MAQEVDLEQEAFDMDEELRQLAATIPGNQGDVNVVPTPPTEQRQPQSPQVSDAGGSDERNPWESDYEVDEQVDAHGDSDFDDLPLFSYNIREVD